MTLHERSERGGARRWVAVPVAAALSVALIGCGTAAPSATPAASPTAAVTASPGTEPTPPVGTGTLRVLTPASGLQVGFEAVAKNFEAAYPTLKIEFQGVPSGATYGQTLLTQLQAGTAPDVFYTNGGSGSPEAILPLAAAGRLADLSGRAWAGDVPSIAEGLYWSGDQLYGLPLYLNPLGVVYNVDEFARLSLTPPTTFDALLAMCGTIKDAGKVPIAIPGQFPRLLGQILSASNVYAGDPTWDAKRSADQVTFAGTQGWASTIQDFVAMNDAGCFQPGVQSVGVPQSFSLIGSGQALMYAGPASGMGGILAVDPTLNLAMFPMPGHTASSTRVMAGYFDALAVNATSSMLPDAQRLLDFFAQPDQQAVFAEAAGGISIAEAAAGTLPTRFQLLASLFASQAVVGRAQDAWPGAQVVGALDDALVGSITGQLTVEEGLARLDAAWAEASRGQ